ncbi:hypothetical protein LCGC14_0065980 [marine sediment metagenome]|uniref:Uncharacterized protein n=1 Tax=marine sediment metagenome TaxID=412755 RepID=A0A0F9VQ42_9ZZZZ|nr:hypothetical protein [Maribacter sp.]
MMPSTGCAIKSGELPKTIQAYLTCVNYVGCEIERPLGGLNAR